MKVTFVIQDLFSQGAQRATALLCHGFIEKGYDVDLIVSAFHDAQMMAGKTGFFRRLSYSRPSPTLVTNPAMPATDLCHPTKNRPLSVEEYKSIQEFPQECNICGPILEKYKQIGNAVPIKLGEAIARTILADMEGKKLPSYKGFSFSRYRNTSDISWQIAMDKAIKKELHAKENGQVSLF